MSRKKVQHIVLEGIQAKSTTKKSLDTAETITIKSNYSENDISSLEHLNFSAGTAPF